MSSTKWVDGFGRLVRVPNLFMIAATQYLVRIFLIGPAEAWQAHLLDPRFFLLVLSTLLIASAGYIINDYYDVKIDFINKPDRVVVGTLMRRRVAMFTHSLFNFLGIFIGILLGWEIALLNFFCAFCLWIYSNQLKRLPLVGNFTIASLTAASVLIVDLYFHAHEPLIFIFATFSFYISLIREIIKDMEDLRGDMHFGCKTLPIVWGIRKTKWLLYAVLALFIFSIWLLLPVINATVMNAYFLVMSLPTGYFVYQLYWADTRKAYGQLSFFCKLIMLSGMIIMIFI